MLSLKKRKKSEELSQSVSWGHWFALFNIILSFIIASRYLFISEWPSTALGQFYAAISFIGQFSFVVFALYLIILFPITFLVRSIKWLKLIAIILATMGLSLILIDLEVYSRFRLHINYAVWELLLSDQRSALLRDWQWFFVFVPVIFLVELFYASWSWKKLRSLNKRHFGKPLALFFFLCFIGSHFMHIWADAQFYRPITTQKSNLPLSYPMTARHFLEKYGLLDQAEYKKKVAEYGKPAAVSVTYPLSPLKLQENYPGYNILFVVINRLDSSQWQSQLPVLADFAKQNIYFSNHYSTSSQLGLNLFSLFYGISPNYYDGILAGRKTSALLDVLNRRGYYFGLFSNDSFNLPFYHQALLSNFSLPEPAFYTNDEITQQWLGWFHKQTEAQWFSYINYDLMQSAQVKAPLLMHDNNADLNRQLMLLFNALKDANRLDNTIVIVTSAQGNTNKTYAGNNNDELSHLRVPLVVHWPDKHQQVITSLTSHLDISRTLLEDALGVKTVPSTYSQGDDLFNQNRDYQWILAGDTMNLVVITKERITKFNPHGYYEVYDHNLVKLDEKLNLPIFLQVMTEMRRFIAD